jgi:acyl-coenzyme A synthetase/AMP-(fatty) acid ligase
MPDDRGTLRDALTATAASSGRMLSDVGASVALRDLLQGSSFGGRLHELQGRSILLATRDQLSALVALVELDGVARRIVLCPPGLPAEHLGAVAADAAADALVSDRPLPSADMLDIACRAQVSPQLVPAAAVGRQAAWTQWVLLTSGTTGAPKLVVHTLATLAGAVRADGAAYVPVWSTFYDIRRYGGLQIALRALLGTGSLMLSNGQETTADFLDRAGAHGVTHISGTPSHWRRALMSPHARSIAPRYVRLSGEIADQALLDQLKARYPQARVAHAFASTEAGVAFEVADGLAGFPAVLLGRTDAGVEMQTDGGSLRIRSPRCAIRYLGAQDKPLADEAGFVDTGDTVELRGDRYHFVGRRDGIINIGGLKVHPEEVEAVINRHPGVRMSLVTARKSPITGALVAADIVPICGTEIDRTATATALRDDILAACRGVLAPHKVPAVIRFVPSLGVAASGKVARPRA